jgi:DNA-binding response OmpR family regulator
VARILIVEDEPVINRALMDVLREEGHEVFSAGDGKAGTELALQEKPDLILMNLNLPTIDGIAAIRYLRNRLPPSRTRIIALSDAGTLYDHAGELLADSLIAKPYDIHMLLAEVTVQLNRIADPAASDTLVSNGPVPPVEHLSQ